MHPPTRRVKQVLVVRKDLKMRKGKIGAQCAHAAMKVMLDLCSRTVDADGHRILKFEYGNYTAWQRWLETGSAKVCVYVDSEEQLLDIYKQAKDAGLPASLIVDAGKTEFGGVPTRTVVAVGPAWVEDVDEITRDLPLY